MNIRMLPPIAVGRQTLKVNGRTYSVSAGSVADVPDFDAAVLDHNGWFRVAPSGTTAQRPANTAPQSGSSVVLGAGLFYWDTTLGKLVVYDGATWRDPASGSAV